MKDGTILTVHLSPTLSADDIDTMKAAIGLFRGVKAVGDGFALEQTGGRTGRRRAFIKPTVDEVRAYCEERKNGIDAQAFVDHYDKVGWVVGKNQTPMKDWRATIRTWERTRRERNQQSGGNDQWAGSI